MKKTTTILAAILLAAVSMTAQNPKLSYSAVVRKSDNELVANQQVYVAITIKNSPDAPNWVYAETYTVTTNQNGLLSLNIGDGTVVGGDLAYVNWKTAHITTSYTLPNGETLTSTMPVTAVPYALYAESASNVNQVKADWTETDESEPSFIENKPILAEVATTGSYNSLSDKPDINNGTLTITLPDGTSETFTANQPGNTQVTIPAPEMTVEELIGLISGMTEEEIEALKEALGVTGGGEEPGGEEPTTFNCGDNLIIGENSYPTVQIGTQCWTKTNMREPAGTQGTSSTDTSSTAPYYYVKPGVDADTNGYYYNWPAANQVCPAGWHLPSDDEWTQLTDYVSNAQVGAEYIYRCAQSNANSIGKALAFEKGWKNSSGECYVGDQSSKPNNTTGFSAVPAGYYTGSSSSLSREMAFFWSSTENSIATAYVRYLHYYNSNVYVGNQYTKYMGYSVRCLRDAEPGGGEEPGGEEPTTFNCGDNLIIGENSYPTVQIGTQCWTKTNLREAVGTNGTDLTSDNYSYTEPFYYVNPNVDAAVYGYYYNWPAANQVCPEGWHLPDTTEWNTMQVYVSTAKDAYGNYMYRCEGDSTYIAQALATDGDYWYRGDVSESYPCEPEYDLTKNNKTGFSAVPAGYWPNGFSHAGYSAYFWSSTESGSDDAWRRYLNYNYERVLRGYYYRDSGFSVRCVRDAEPGGGEEPGGEEPTTFNCGTSKMVDADGNQYETVQIGTQCWTKTNLREAVGTNGTDLTSDNYSYTEPYYYVNPNVDAAVYGYYYNWPAANQVCPEGWHLPDTTEWNTMQVYVSTAKDAYGNYMYRCEGDSTYIAQALATDGDYWYRGDVSESYPCEPEYDLTKNNKTGFSAVPAGLWDNGFDYAGNRAYFWSSPEYGTDNAWYRALSYRYEYVGRYYSFRYYGFSVRCVRD